MAESRRLRWLRQGIEAVEELDALVAEVDVVVDAIGFTHHHEGLHEPQLDLALNYTVHLPLLQTLNRVPRTLVYLGSRGQYGRVQGVVDESAPQSPIDPQGVHKVALESMIRIYAAKYSWPAVALRLGNCFGPRQPMGNDPGLIAVIVKGILGGEDVQIYGSHERREHMLYAPDLARIVTTLAERSWTGVTLLNVPGLSVSLTELAATLVRLTRKGSYSVRPFPPEIASLHAGEAIFSDARLAELGLRSYTPLEPALDATLRAVARLDHDLAV
jgi:UDP-glucose 4-epimerase